MQIAWQLAERNAPEAFEIAVSISDQADRSKVLTRTISKWPRDDLESARAAVEAAELPDTERQDLLERLD